MEEYLNFLEVEVSKILNRYVSLKDKYHLLETQVEDNKKQIEKLQKMNGVLQKENELIKISKLSNENGQANQILKNKLATLTREVDYCIEVLKKRF